MEGTFTGPDEADVVSCGARVACEVAAGPAAEVRVEVVLDSGMRAITDDVTAAETGWLLMPETAGGVNEATVVSGYECVGVVVAGWPFCVVKTDVKVAVGAVDCDTIVVADEGNAVNGQVVV